MKRTKHTTIEEVLEHTRARIEEYGDGGGGGCLIGNDVDIWTAHRCRITVEDAKRRRLASMAEGTMPLPLVTMMIMPRVARKYHMVYIVSLSIRYRGVQPTLISGLRKLSLSCFIPGQEFLLESVIFLANHC